MSRRLSSLAELYGRQGDPYDAAATRERELGYRYPTPYAATEAALRQQSRAWSPPARVPPVFRVGGPEDAVVSSASVAGRRVTDRGGIGVPGSVFDVDRGDARTRAGYAELGARGPGTALEWDAAEDRRRISGRIVGTGSMTQTVHRDRPFLILRATASVAVQITVGMSGGFEQTRRFFLGGGYTTSFLLADYDTVTLVVTASEAATTEMQFAWMTDGMQGGDQTLYLPQRITAAMVGVFQAVPEGAFGLYAESNDVAWVWDAPVLAGFTVAPGAGFPGIVAGPIAGGVATQQNQVLGTRFSPSLANDVVWSLRPI